MDVREKLVELIKRAKQSWSTSTMMPYDCTFESWIADHLIANGIGFVTDNNVGSKWISVKDRLPGKGTGHVLVVKQLRGKSYVDMGEVIGETACCYSDEYCINPREHIFTHWMPLPQPPKGD